MSLVVTYPGVHQPHCRIFYFKSVDRAVSFLQKYCCRPLARFAPEFMLQVYMFARAVNDSVWFCCYFLHLSGSSTLVCFVKCFSDRANIKLVMVFFYFAFYMLFVNVLCEIVCLFSCLLPMLFDLIYIPHACVHFAAFLRSN